MMFSYLSYGWESQKGEVNIYSMIFPTRTINTSTSLTAQV